jgi:uncharacterized repeat protein (TIGR01451 family)
MLFGLFLVVGLTLPFSSASNPLADDCLPKDPPPPVVKLKVRVPACSEPGGNLEYCICVENCSPSEAHHVLVKNALPANAKFVKSDPAPTKQEPELQWNLGTIGGGASREIKLVLQPTNKEDVKNCVRVQFEHGLCVTTRQAHRMPFPGEGPPVIRPMPGVSPEDMPILELKVNGPTQQYANLPAKYDITVTNKGKTKAGSTLVSARLPGQLKLVKASEPNLAEGNQVYWLFEQLDPGASKTLQLTLKATDKGEHCFTVSAKTEYVHAKDVEFCTKFAGASALSVEMFGRDGAMFVGGKTSYPIKIVSLANEPLTNVEVKAFVPEALKVERANVNFDEQPPEKNGQWIKFRKLPQIDGGAQTTYEIFVEALKPGVTRFHVEVMADQLDAQLGAVIEQELTHIVDDRGKAKLIELSRKKALQIEP